MGREDQPGVARIPRGALRTSRRAGQEHSTFVRSGNFGSTEERTLEVPTPLADIKDHDPVRVLHVDDNPGITDVTATFLERINDDFEVTTTTTVVEALDLLGEEDFDCVISDYQMPRTDGLEFLELVRERYPDLPFVLFTGKGSEEIASEAIAAGVTDYMQKGGGTDQYEVLSNRVENAVDQYRTQQQFWDALSWYQRLVEQGVAGVFVVQDRELAYVNRKFADIFGYGQEELLGESPLVLVADAEHDAVVDVLSDLPERCDDTFRGSFTGRRKDGRTLRVEVHGGVTDYGGEPATTGIVRDVDEK
jgi:PAS domain S-box-containing protein